MGRGEPVARVEGRPTARVFATPRPYAVGGAAGTVAGAGALLTGVGNHLPGATPVTGAVAVGVVAGFLALCGTVVVVARRDLEEVRFYETEFVVAGRPDDGNGDGGESATRTVEYDEVDLVVRREGDPKTYELLRSGKSPVVLRNVTDPRTVERTLYERVPSPEERNEAARESTDESMAERLADRVPMSQTAERVRDEGSGDRPIGHERTFWRRWPSDHPLPDSPVVGESAYRRVVGGDSLTASETPEWAEHTATVDPAETNVEEFARGQYGEQSAGELFGEGAWFGKEKSRIEDGEHDY